ncbi:hypothetical protein COX08_04420 [Candidatus Beckwithbacteria bacterium CG23_combo_of_CG06-09_8_20_14_all_34_8]|uniref:Uncharacterized protein n=1 Tax=Candidatus Beckwithbacteria bacterium CG23_combo_of_CG06-09_8_20_14_all_34_8 TaxID=1974497 RepID=A0A2H0B6Y0_9BACT|nr:MAG: hypothetical protein COX08_04420 [Candidatus Beckwithbacteria bacterium CG23_combo_of_CG06-09_8_20_14_all_34_8]
MYKQTTHQKNQINIINQIEKQIKDNLLGFSTVAPIEDYENDTRLCLTSVHLPNSTLIKQISNQIITPLKKIEPHFYWYKPTSQHLTIKNIKVINDPPHFSETDIDKVETVFSRVVLKYKSFQIYFYRLLLFPNNLALIGTTDPTLDAIISDLNHELKVIDIPDDKVYINRSYFFSNMTLCRFNSKISQKFRDKVKIISDSIRWQPYTIDSITLLSCNAVLEKKRIINTWNLKLL